MTGCGRVALPQAAADLLRRTQALLLALFPAADQKAEEQVLFRSDPELALRHYGNAILRTAYTYLRNRSDAEDVVQDTLVQLLVADPGFESPAHEKAWLLRVAINLSKNKLRQAQRHGCQSIDESFPGLAPEEEDLSFVWEAVSGLPERYREVIHLFYQEDYSTAQIAQILNKKESTVRSLLHRGRELLPRLHQTENPVVEKPSYVVEYDTLEELTASLTFPLQIPSVVPEGYTRSNYVNQFGMAQVIWTCGEKQLKYYMLDGPMNDTGSSYPLHKTVDGIRLSGSEEGWLVAEWSDETCSYALVSLGTVLPEEDFLNAAHSLEAVK